MCRQYNTGVPLKFRVASFSPTMDTDEPSANDQATLKRHIAALEEQNAKLLSKVEKTPFVTLSAICIPERY